MKKGRPVYIYGLYDPRDSRLRYIGKTVNLKARLRRHCVDYDRGKVTHCSTWVKGILNDGLKPIMKVLEECTEDDWRKIEKTRIKEAKRAGHNLTNMVEGGEGGAVKGRKLSEKTKRKISKALKGRIVTWAKPLTAEQKAKLAAKRAKQKPPRLGMKNSPEQNARIGAANSIALKGRKVSDAERERLRQMAIKRWRNKK